MRKTLKTSRGCLKKSYFFSIWAFPIVHSFSILINNCKLNCSDSIWNYFRGSKMFYFLRARPQPEPKAVERPLPKYGKLFIILFTLFHALFLIFNMYYFMPKTNDAIENDTAVVEDSGFENEIWKNLMAHCLYQANQSIHI